MSKYQNIIIARKLCMEIQLMKPLQGGLEKSAENV